jgi:hypothetical protein
MKNFYKYYVAYWCLLFLRLLYLLFLDLDVLLGYIPDDSFYYLEIAKNFTELGIWSFDGINPSSGFHILYAYFIASLIYLLGASNFYGIFVFSSLVNITLLTISFKNILELLTCYFPKPKLIILFLLPTFLSFYNILNSTFILESSFTIYFSSALIYFLFTKNIVKNLYIKLALISFFGQLFRMDFGITSFLLLIFFFYIFFKKNKLYFKFIIPITFSTLALILQVIHNYFFNISFPPSSTTIKSFWSGNQSFLLSIKSSLLIFFRDVSFSFAPLDGYGYISFLIPSLILLFILFVVYKNQDTLTYFFSDIFLFSLFSCFIFFSFYSRNGAIQNWYIQNIHVYMSILLVFLLTYLNNNISFKKIMFFKIFLFFSILFSFLTSFMPVWPWQTLVYHQANRVEVNKIPQVGAFNAGILGYFTCSTRVINLDGLVNDNVSKYLISNNIEGYCKDNHIEYIADFELKEDVNMGISKSFSKKLIKVDSISTDVVKSRVFTLSNLENHYLYKIK